MSRKKYIEKRRMDFQARFKVINAFPGDWESIFTGDGDDFAGIREHQPEDDLRKICWPLVAKTNKYMVRENIALRDIKILVSLDLSPSMGFHLKPEIIDIFTGLVGSLASRSSIPFGFLGVSGNNQYFFPPRSGWNHLDEILEWLLAYEFMETGRETEFQGVANFVLANLPRQSIVFFISDFSERIREQELRILSRYYDTIAIMVRDPLEVSFPKTHGEFSFRSFDGKEIHTLLNSKRVSDLNEMMRADLIRTVKILQDLDVDTLPLDSPDPEEAFMRFTEFFRLRKLRRR